ncbi:hypothetical protein PR048_031133 [Dryococelus australis]|uniref:Uncharacterized protein n=1 Tax=Dryococelus australis TaxID=614101 RepID=A0ABQ9G5J1_9NEOP|nr:hypothetical protein PR048_031133 [Dryococelus australis]
MRTWRLRHHRVTGLRLNNDTISANAKCTKFNDLPTSLYSLMYKYADINCALVVCCHSGRRRLGQLSPVGVKHHADQWLNIPMFNNSIGSHDTGTLTILNFAHCWPALCQYIAEVSIENFLRHFLTLLVCLAGQRLVVKVVWKGGGEEEKWPAKYRRRQPASRCALVCQAEATRAAAVDRVSWFGQKPFLFGGEVAGAVSGYRASHKTKSDTAQAHWAEKVDKGYTAMLKFQRAEQAHFRHGDVKIAKFPVDPEDQKNRSSFCFVGAKVTWLKSSAPEYRVDANPISPNISLCIAIGCCLLEKQFSSYVISVQTVNTCQEVSQPIKTGLLVDSNRKCRFAGGGAIIIGLNCSGNRIPQVIMPRGGRLDKPWGGHWQTLINSTSFTPHRHHPLTGGRVVLVRRRPRFVRGRLTKLINRRDGPLMASVLRAEGVAPTGHRIRENIEAKHLLSPTPAQSSPSTVTADNNCAADIGILVYTTVESSLQCSQEGCEFTSVQQPMEKQRRLQYTQYLGLFPIVPDYAIGRRVFSGISRFPCPCILALLHTHLVSPLSALKTSLLRAGQISALPLHQSASVNFHTRLPNMNSFSRKSRVPTQKGRKNIPDAFGNGVAALTHRGLHAFTDFEDKLEVSPISTTARTPVLLVSVLELTIVLLVHTTPDTTLHFTAYPQHDENTTRQFRQMIFARATLESSLQSVQSYRYPQHDENTTRQCPQHDENTTRQFRQMIFARATLESSLQSVQSYRYTQHYENTTRQFRQMIFARATLESSLQSVQSYRCPQHDENTTRQFRQMISARDTFESSLQSVQSYRYPQHDENTTRQFRQMIFARATLESNLQSVQSYRCPQHDENTTRQFRQMIFARATLESSLQSVQSYRCPQHDENTTRQFRQMIFARATLESSLQSVQSYRCPQHYENTTRQFRQMISARATLESSLQSVQSYRCPQHDENTTRQFRQMIFARATLESSLQSVQSYRCPQHDENTTRQFRQMIFARATLESSLQSVQSYRCPQHDENTTRQFRQMIFARATLESSLQSVQSYRCPQHDENTTRQFRQMIFARATLESSLQSVQSYRCPQHDENTTRQFRQMIFARATLESSLQSVQSYRCPQHDENTTRQFRQMIFARATLESSLQSVQSYRCPQHYENTTRQFRQMISARATLESSLQSVQSYRYTQHYENTTRQFRQMIFARATLESSLQSVQSYRYPQHYENTTRQFRQMRASAKARLMHSPPSALTHSRLHSSVSHPLVHSRHEHFARQRPGISSRRPHFTSLAHTRQTASVKACRPLGCGSIYSVLGRHLESSPTRVMRHGELRLQPVSPEHSCVVAKPVETSSSGEGP